METEPMITLAQSALQQLHAQADTAWAKVTELEKQLEEERAKTPDDRFTDTSALLEALKEIADHAVANLHPQFIRDLPVIAFTIAGVALPDSLGATQRDIERSAVWLERAKLIQEWRDKRKADSWETPPPPAPVAPWGVTPSPAPKTRGRPPLQRETPALKPTRKKSPR